MQIDPTIFSPDAVSRETATFNEQLAQLLSAMPPITRVTPQQVRDARRKGEGAFPPPVYSDMAEDRTIDGPAGPLRLRVFAGDRADGVFLHLHGGGWTVGAADMQDPFLEAMAKDAGVVVVSVDYRLAPEHPYPAPNDDCEAAAVWLVERIVDEWGTDKLLVGGESAGAHLAVTTMLRMRDRHDYTGWAGANLVYGAYDLSGTPSQLLWDRGYLVLDADTMAWFNDHYLGGTAADLRDPDVSPLYGRLDGLPPALFTVGTWDPLLDDTLFMASRWAEHALDVDLAVYPGGVHAFDAFPISIAVEARSRMHAWIRDRVA